MTRTPARPVSCPAGRAAGRRARHVHRARLGLHDRRPSTEAAGLPTDRAGDGAVAARIVCVSEFDRKLGIAAGMSPDRLVTIHNGISTSTRPARLPGYRRAIRRVMIARFDQQKDHETLFRALTDAARPRGRPGRRWSGHGRCPPPGRSGRTRYPAFISSVSGLMSSGILARSHIFVLTSHWEGFPRSTLEAMRAGLPVVVSDVGGASEAITDGVTGFLVAAGDREQLAERIRDLVRSPTPPDDGRGRPRAVRARVHLRLDAGSHPRAPGRDRCQARSTGQLVPIRDTDGLGKLGMLFRILDSTNPLAWARSGELPSVLSFQTPRNIVTRLVRWI